MVRVPERLYHLILIHFYQSRYDDAVCAYLKVYPELLSLSREVYPISRVSRLFGNISRIMSLFLARQSAANFRKAKEGKTGYTFLDRSMRSVYNKNKEEPYA